MTKTNMWKIERIIMIMIDEDIWDNETLIELNRRLKRLSEEKRLVK